MDDTSSKSTLEEFKKSIDNALLDIETHGMTLSEASKKWDAPTLVIRWAMVKREAGIVRLNEKIKTLEILIEIEKMLAHLEEPFHENESEKLLH